MYFVNLVALLLPIVGFCANTSKLTEFVRRIFDESDSDTVCFVRIGIGIDENENDDYLTASMIMHLKIPVSIYTTSIRESEHLIVDNAVVVVRAPAWNEKFSYTLNSFIARLRVRKFIIIVASNVEHLQRWFSFFKDEYFTRIFGIAGDECYAYMPFADIHVQRIVFEETLILPDALKDFNGFTFRTSLQRDIPRSFPYPGKDGKRLVGGSYGQVFVNFLRRHNANYKEIVINNSTRLSIPGVINATINKEIDISMNVYTPTPGLDYSYPVKYVSWNIIVPINGYVDPNQYFIKPFSGFVWALIGISFIYIILMEVLKNIYLHLPPGIWNSFSQTMLAMLNLSPEKPITSAYRFHIQVLFLSFILGKLYNIYVTSFLTAFIRIKQYDTVQDLIDNNVSVMIPYYEWALISDQDLHPENFEKIVASVDYATYITEMNSMKNTSYAYGVGSDRGEFLIGLQTYFAKPLFHSTQDGLVDLHLGFLLAPHSPFTDILSHFIIDVMDTGLIIKWDNDAIVQGIKAGFEVDKAGAHPHQLPIPLNFDHLLFSWNCLFVGWIFATVVFIGEHWRWFLGVLDKF